MMKSTIMSEWWSYSLRDLLLFSPHTYYRLFELYNQALWPLQLLALAIGAGILLVWRKRSPHAGRYIAALLALCWAWVAWAYHWQRYASINWAAEYFALAFALEAALLLWLGVARNGLQLRDITQAKTGLALFVFALLAYPALGMLQGRSLAQGEIFGLMPDPTTLATLGLLLLFNIRKVAWLMPIPVLWSAISAATLWAMGAADFWLLPLAALITISLMMRKKGKGQVRPYI
jgi:hypothetical protein